MYSYAQSRLKAPRYTATVAAAALMTLLSGYSAHAYSGMSLGQVQARKCGAQLANGSMSSLSNPEAYIGGGPRSNVDVGASVKLDIVEQELGSGLQAVRNCGATYIGGNWLITAAHCVEDGKYMRIEVTAGASHIDAPQSVKRVAVDAVCHAEYDPKTMRNDIALIRLNKPLPANVRPARLAAFTERNRAGVAEVTAWRRTRDGSIAPNARRAFLSLNGRQSTDMILAHPQPGAYESVCIGESGSGLFQSSSHGHEQIGVFSAVEASVAINHVGPAEVKHCDRPDTRLIFTPVAEFSEWVRNVVNVCDSASGACQINPNSSGKFGYQVADIQGRQTEPYLNNQMNRQPSGFANAQPWDVGAVQYAEPVSGWQNQNTVVYTDAVPQYPVAHHEPVHIAYADLDPVYEMSDDQVPTYTNYAPVQSQTNFNLSVGSNQVDYVDYQPRYEAPSYVYEEITHIANNQSNSVLWDGNPAYNNPVVYNTVAEDVVYTTAPQSAPEYLYPTHMNEYVNLEPAPSKPLVYEQIYQNHAPMYEVHSLPYVGASLTTEQSWNNSSTIIEGGGWHPAYAPGNRYSIK